MAAVAPLLVVNPGSTSVKASLIADGRRIAAASFERSLIGERLQQMAEGGISGVVHRVVHGGAELTAATRITDAVLAQIRQLQALAPLHQPACIDAIATTRSLFAGVDHYACFDTAFHSTLPPKAYTYAVPAEWRERYGVRRYGFHGLSHQYASARAAALLHRPLDELRIVTCHLGGGASLCAVSGGRSVDTTMGFTPLAGLVMATRSGDVDPGMLLWLQMNRTISADEMNEVLDKDSGLRGLTGFSDMREVQRRAANGDASATLALEVYRHRLQGAIASMAASMGGIDAVVFTGGVGENDAALRSLAVGALAFFGMAIDESANAGAGDRVISSPGSQIAVLVIENGEDLEMYRQVQRLRENT